VRVVKILDAEVAWFGDPAFDIAFLLNHLALKAVRFPERSRGYVELGRQFLQGYRVRLASIGARSWILRSARSS